MLGSFAIGSKEYGGEFQTKQTIYNLQEIFNVSENKELRIVLNKTENIGVSDIFYITSAFRKVIMKVGKIKLIQKTKKSRLIGKTKKVIKTIN